MAITKEEQKRYDELGKQIDEQYHKVWELERQVDVERKKLDELITERSCIHARHFF